MGGTPKGLLALGRRRILDRIVEQASAAFPTPPLLVANHPEAPGWVPGLATVADVLPGYGALGGLYTAVMATPAPVVVVAWDMPFVTGEFLRYLGDQLTGWDAVVPASPGPRGTEPLCAGYGPAAGPAIRAAIDRGDFRAVSFHDSLRVKVVGPETTARFGDPAKLFCNVNTPADLRAAESWLEGPAR